MNSFLSLLLCVAMMMSGAFLNEDVDAATSYVNEISNIVLSVDGTDYPIDASVLLGAKSENGACVLSFGMTMGEQTLFPVQAKISADGLGLLLGQSSVNYTFTDDYFDSLFFDDTFYDEDELSLLDTLLEQYVSLLSNATQLSAQSYLTERDPEKAKAFNDYILSLADDLQIGDSTLTIDGNEVASETIAFSLNTPDLVNILDYYFENNAPELGESVLEFVRTSFIFAGEELPEFSTVSELFDAVATLEDAEYCEDELVVQYEHNLTADVQGTVDAQLIITEEEDDDFWKLTVPMHMEFSSANDFTFDCTFSEPEMDLGFHMEGAVHEHAMEYTLRMEDMIDRVDATEEDEEKLIYTVHQTYETADDGAYSTQYEMSYDFYGEGALNVSAATDAAADLTSHSTMNMEVLIDEHSFGFSCDVDCGMGEFEDRISEAKVTEINSDEETSNATGLALAAVGLSSDVEKLMSDEGVMAVIDAYSELMSAYDDYEEFYGEDYSYSDDPEDLPFTVPTFAYLPEGYDSEPSYESSSADLDYSYGYYYVSFENGEDMLYMNISYSDSRIEDEFYVLADDGSVAPINGTMLQYAADDDYRNVSWTQDGAIMSITAYDSEIDLDTLVKIIEGISFEIKAE